MSLALAVIWFVRLSCIASKYSIGAIKVTRWIFNPHSTILVGDGGIGAEDFLSMNIKSLFD